MQPPLERFSSEYQDYHGLSDGRRQHQLAELEAVSALAGKPLVECDAADIKAYLAIEIKRVSPNTVRKKLGMIRPFFKWAWEAGLIEADRLMAVQSIANPRGSTARGIPRPYSRKELVRMREQIEATFPYTEDYWLTRWKQGTSRYKRVRLHIERLQIEAMVSLALHCGLRKQELHRASLDDIHYDNQWVVVRYPKDFEGKADHREVPHTEHSREAVRRWIEMRVDVLRDERLTSHQKKRLERGPWLFLGRSESRATEPMEERRLRDILADIGEGWEWHRLRHTYGTEMLRSTGRIEIVQRLMGHADVQQTLGYAQLVRDDLHTAVGKAERSFTEAVNGGVA